MHSETIIPIFPLGLVLLPEMFLPLHIFEERYKSMMKACMQQRMEFGIVYFIGKQFQTKGCTARIVEILKRYDDGRLDIMTQGENRFAIKELFDEKPYLQAKVEFFDDQPEENTSAENFQKLAQRGIQMLRQINTTTDQYENNQFTGRLDIKSVSFSIAASDGFSFEEKQQFLGMTSTLQRLRKAVKALEKIVERQSITREIERIIGGNGKLPKSLQNRLKQN
ncbi:MAG: LON peptidase substrate-binding domain-containing protein [Desulfobacterales bacterium]|jgi:ATP-dependent Lon protease|nr:LON peptidase substrate-binding domain-containing protein [Desulfobacterales bacterium]